MQDDITDLIELSSRAMNLTITSDRVDKLENKIITDFTKGRLLHKV